MRSKLMLKRAARLMIVQPVEVRDVVDADVVVQDHGTRLEAQAVRFQHRVVLWMMMIWKTMRFLTLMPT
jgi:hypothetical protein